MHSFPFLLQSVTERDFIHGPEHTVHYELNEMQYFTERVCVALQNLQVAQKEAQIRLLEGQLRQTDVIGSSHNHMILDAIREKAECIPELQALIQNVQQGVYIQTGVFCK